MVSIHFLRAGGAHAITISLVRVTRALCSTRHKADEKERSHGELAYVWNTIMKKVAQDKVDRGVGRTFLY